MNKLNKYARISYLKQNTSEKNFSKSHDVSQSQIRLS